MTNFIKLNENDEYLSLGNLFRIIKELSKNKSNVMQTELFCIMFDLEDVNNTTVNNYCVGCRSIGDKYKQIFLNKKVKYKNDKTEFLSIILSFLRMIEGVNSFVVDNIDFINNDENAKMLAKKLYNLAKNDKQVSDEFVDELNDLININDVYTCLVKELLFIVLEKKQPISEKELKKHVFDVVLNDTSISSLDLQDYLSLKLREGINYDYSLRNLSDLGNAYANFEIGCNEYYGYVKGFSRYDVAFEYLKKAALKNHPGANYMIGNMYVKSLIGSGSSDELEKGYEYLVKSYELGNVAASNLIGFMYLNGIYPLKKDIEEARKYFNIAINEDYAYAYNNMGKIYCDLGDKNEAFKYFIKAANLGESWACNKVGEFYRQGIIVKDMKKAFEYYNKALESNYRTLCYYAYYNLAKYYYLNGYDDIVLVKDEEKAIDYFNIASNNGIIEASLELLIYYVDKYIECKDKKIIDNVIEIKNRIESHSKYNAEMFFVIKDILDKLYIDKCIDIKVITIDQV